MHTSTYQYRHGEETLHGFLAYDDSFDLPRPAVLIAHDWTGCNQFASEKAKFLAKMGYVGFAIDMYGQGRMGETTDEKMALMEPLINDRVLLRNRIHAAFDAVTALDRVDSNNIAAIGFCFGGLCVLDLARSGARLKGVVSFHGLLNRPAHLANQSISAKMLVLHGYDDPMVKPEDVNHFCQEMTEAQVDWQVHQYGHTQHGFTNPLACDPVLGTVYSKTAERRSLQAMMNFLNEIFN